MVGASGVRGFETVPLNPAEATSEGADIYVMDAGNDCFGWVRAYKKDNTGGTKSHFPKKEMGNLKFPGSIPGPEKQLKQTGKRNVEFNCS
jgi:hypothetical protein